MNDRYVSFDPSRIEIPANTGNKLFEFEINEDIVITDKNRSINYICRLLNKKYLKESEKLVVDILPFTQSFNSPLVQETYLYYKLALPKTPILIISIEDTAFSKQNMKSFKKHGLDFISESILNAVKNLNKKFVFAGGSFGGAVSAAMAAHAKESGVDVYCLALRDPAGIKKMFSVEQIIRFGAHAGIDSKLANQKETIISKIDKKNLLIARLLRAGRLKNDLISAMENNPNLFLHISYGEKNLICPRVEIRKFVRELDSRGYISRSEILEIKDYKHHRGKYNKQLSYIFGELTKLNLLTHIQSISKPLEY